MRIHLIRTLHPHWGQHTGAHQFIRYLAPERFQVDERVVAMGDNDFPVKTGAVRLPVKYLVRRQGMRVYGLNDLLAEFDAGRQWWRNQIDILHYLEGEHTLQFLPSIVHRLHRLRRRPPIVATFHQPPELLDRLINVKHVRHLDRVIVLAPEQRSYFEQHLPAERVCLILHGVDTGFFRPAEHSGPRATFRCLSVGSWLRDYDTVLQVAQRFRSMPEFEFQIVSNAVQAPAGAANVSVCSGIDDDALRTLYQRANLLFLPVLSATANNAILEAIACGLPVVTTDLASLRSYLPGPEAMLIKDNDPGRMAEALLKIYRSPAVQAEMAAAARRRALELSWPNIAREHANLYQSLVAPSQALEGPGIGNTHGTI